MAKVYYIDFIIPKYVTKVIEADSEEQAEDIASQLSDSICFWNDELFGAFCDAPTEKEELEVSVVDAGADPEIFVGDDRFMTAEDLTDYID